MPSTPEKYRARRRLLRDAYAEYDRNYHIRKEYGLLPADYEAIAKKQQGLCAICGNIETRIDKRGDLTRLHVDHCHATNKIRGLLCNNCNAMLGYAKESLATLQAAMTYLKCADTGHVAVNTKNVSTVLSTEESVALAKSVLEDMMKS